MPVRVGVDGRVTTTLSVQHLLHINSSLTAKNMVWLAIIMALLHRYFTDTTDSASIARKTQTFPATETPSNSAGAFHSSTYLPIHHLARLPSPESIAPDDQRKIVAKGFSLSGTQERSVVSPGSRARRRSRKQSSRRPTNPKAFRSLFYARA